MKAGGKDDLMVKVKGKFKFLEVRSLNLMAFGVGWFYFGDRKWIGMYYPIQQFSTNVQSAQYSRQKYVHGVVILS